MLPCGDEAKKLTANSPTRDRSVHLMNKCLDKHQVLDLTHVQKEAVKSSLTHVLKEAFGVNTAKCQDRWICSKAVHFSPKSATFLPHYDFFTPVTYTQVGLILQKIR